MHNESLGAVIIPIPVVVIDNSFKYVTQRPKLHALSSHHNIQVGIPFTSSIIQLTFTGMLLKQWEKTNSTTPSRETKEKYTRVSRWTVNCHMSEILIIIDLE